MKIRQFGAEFFGTFWLVLGGWAVRQLWLFWVAPIIGGVLGGIVYRWLGEDTARRPVDDVSASAATV